MSVTDALMAFTFAAALLTLTPGLDTALILRTATVEGTRKAIQAQLGINAGCLAWAAAVAFGLGALIAVSELAYNLLKWCGAGYLAWLGVQMLLKPRQQMGDVTLSSGSQNAFLRGFFGNLLNPKVGIFYVSFLPQFIPTGHSPVLWTFGLVLIHVVLGTLWSALLIGSTRKLSGILKQEGVVKWLDRTTGAVFLLFAAKLALSRRPG
ncbi:MULTISPECIES: LysE family translocator [Erwiniaceae]|uniref:LysE family translocator n=2 Tax=Erwiniaceae TaxID=1903409 RepID=A0ACC5RR82_ENTAG|nr:MULTISPECIES: LysE family translocator [Erwiniaceae]MBK4726823.1 LysE family translocator [Pantoea agglomerans]MBP2152464.1 threonine/homoserine/homoserine lactone efflux protein [Erwinia rhapontici]MCS3609226.1 threonine/homoserine/homoserine lactone efflux protein [Erwinia rhapontici]NKG28798.1 LysE family translocator [Erwinia rhapontici]NNS09138.1 LysE family translocator [Erwinia sp. JH02]